MLSLVGHMSRAMLARYSHIRIAAKVEAVRAISLRPEVQNSEMVRCESPALQPRAQAQ